MGMVKTTSMDPLGEKGGSTLDLHSCPYESLPRNHTRIPSFLPTGLLGIDRLLPKAMVVPRDLGQVLSSEDRAAIAVTGSLSSVTTDTAAKGQDVGMFTGQLKSQIGFLTRQQAGRAR